NLLLEAAGVRHTLGLDSSIARFAAGGQREALPQALEEALVLPVLWLRTRTDQIHVFRGFHRALGARGNRVQPRPGASRLRSDEQEPAASLDEAAQVSLRTMGQLVGRGVQEDEAAIEGQAVFRDHR